MGTIGLPEILTILLFSPLVIVPFWRIFKKAGIYPELSILMFVPVANVVALYYLAFAAWPSLRNPK